MTVLRAIDHYFRPVVPAERLAGLRIVAGVFGWLYLVLRAGHFTSYARFNAAGFAPVGVVSVLQEPLPPLAVYLIFALAVVSGVGFIFGAMYRASGPTFALCFLWLTTYRSSWGMIFHQDNLACLHLCVISLVPAADAWSYDRRRGAPAPASARYGWAIRTMCILTVVTYVVTGIAKLKNSGLDFASGDVLRTQIAYDAVRKIELGGVHSPIGAYLVRFGWLFPPLGAMTLLLELGAPMALIGKRMARLWAGAVWMFHLSVIALMAITFPYPVSGCAFASFFEVERLPRTRLGRLLLARFAT